MNYRVNLGDLWRDLNTEFDEDTTVYDVKRTFKDASRIIELVDDLLTAKMAHRVIRARAGSFSTIQKAYTAVQDAEAALIGAVVTEHMGG